MAKRREKGEGSVLQIKGCRFWYAQYYKDGRPIRVSTKTEVKQKALVELRKLMGLSENGQATAQETKKVKYGDLRAGLIANYVERGNKSLRSTAEGAETIVGLSKLDAFFQYSADNLGVSVSKITTDATRDFVRQRKAEDAGSAIINRSLALLRRMLRLAKEENKIQNVPVVRLLKEPAARKGFLDLDKFEGLLAVLPSHLRPLITFLYYCGVRLGEATQIEWTQVDMVRWLIRLEDEQTKSGEPRIVPLPAVLVAMLEAIKPKTGRVFDDTNLRVEWQRACVAYKLGTLETMKSEAGFTWYKYEGLIVHDLRRSAIRNLVNNGTPERVAMAISGHKTRAVFDRYMIASTDDVTNAMRRVEAAAVSKGKKPVISVRLVKKRSKNTRKLLTGL